MPFFTPPLQGSFGNGILGLDIYHCLLFQSLAILSQNLGGVQDFVFGVSNAYSSTVLKV
jgi:hypothetical protein